MSIREVENKPEIMAHFPDSPYRWMELGEEADPYAYVAIAERDDVLEAHISMTKWGPQVRRNLHVDLEWFKEEARRLGKNRILGIRANDKGEFDPNLFRFARLYGAVDMCVFQTVALEVE